MESQEDRVDESVRELGRLITGRRKSLGLTQQDTADLASVSVRFISALENGKPTARLNGVLAVLTVLGIDFIASGRDAAGRDQR